MASAKKVVEEAAVVVTVAVVVHSTSTVKPAKRKSPFLILHLLPSPFHPATLTKKSTTLGVAMTAKQSAKQRKPLQMTLLQRTQTLLAV
jgi:hypothetical protein